MHPIELPTPSNSRELIPASATSCDSPTKFDSSDTVSTKSDSSAAPWMKEASTPEELAVLLKRTYAAIRAKEKDIRLAAQVGRALLENNLELKAKQESVQRQMRARQQRNNALLQSPDSPELIIRPSTSVLTRTYDTHATASRILERVNSTDSHRSSISNSSNSSSINNSSGMRLISRDEADQAIAEMLAQKNNDIERLLDSTLAQYNATREADMEKQLKLENEMARLQSQLELAAKTIEQLEHQRQQHQKDVARITEVKDVAAIDEELLAARLSHLQAEHEGLEAGNDAARYRLDQATKSLSLWQKQIADLETINEMYKDQQSAYHNQLTEITRLSGAIEEYRTVAADVQDNPDKAIMSDNDDNDMITTTTTTTATAAAAAAAARGHIQLTFPATARSKSNLFSELERTWATTTREPTPPFKETPRPYSLGPTSTIAPSVDMAHPNSSCSSPSPCPISSSPMMRPPFYPSISPSITSSIDHRHISSASPLPHRHFSTTASSSSIISSPPPSPLPPHHQQQQFGDLSQPLYSNLSVCHSKPPTPAPPTTSCVSKRLAAAAAPRSLLEKHTSIIHLPLQIACKIWAWSRFSLIILLAIVINLWRGPDAILEK